MSNIYRIGIVANVVINVIYRANGYYIKVVDILILYINDLFYFQGYELWVPSLQEKRVLVTLILELFIKKYCVSIHFYFISDAI